MIEAPPVAQHSQLGPLALYRSTIGMKVMMAATGFILYAFIFGNDSIPISILAGLVR